MSEFDEELEVEDLEDDDEELDDEERALRQGQELADEEQDDAVNE